MVVGMGINQVTQGNQRYAEHNAYVIISMVIIIMLTHFNFNISCLIVSFYDAKLATRGQGETDYITIYGLLGLFQSLAFLTAILLVNHRTLAASLRLHNSIFRKVLRSTIDFVWSTPVGQIGNRFSKDMDESEFFTILKN